MLECRCLSMAPGSCLENNSCLAKAACWAFFDLKRPNDSYRITYGCYDYDEPPSFRSLYLENWYRSNQPSMAPKHPIAMAACRGPNRCNDKFTIDYYRSLNFLPVSSASSSSSASGDVGDESPPMLVAHSTQLVTQLVIAGICLLLATVLLAGLLLVVWKLRRRWWQKLLVDASGRRLLSERKGEDGEGDSVDKKEPALNRSHKLQDVLTDSGHGTSPAISHGSDTPSPLGLDELETSLGSGSGSGLPCLAQRTLASQVILRERIGGGTYGEVFRGEWSGRSVAVKVIRSMNIQSYRRETSIYQNAALRHNNILLFFGCDVRDEGADTRFWLITEYHPRGSLRAYLESHFLTDLDLLKITLSVAAGLRYLHTRLALHGNFSKPAIAHRDLKTRNILIRSDGSCCIADLGWAVKSDRHDGLVKLQPDERRKGTPRYMSPELLADTANYDDFNTFRNADVYAMALVFWESCRRSCRFQDDYQPPFYDHIDDKAKDFDGRPSTVTAEELLDKLRQLVSVEVVRPELPAKWRQQATGGPLLVELSRIMEECWQQQPAARMSSLRVEKDLSRVVDRVDGASASGHFL